MNQGLQQNRGALPRKGGVVNPHLPESGTGSDFLSRILDIWVRGGDFPNPKNSVSLEIISHPRTGQRCRPQAASSPPIIPACTKDSHVVKQMLSHGVYPPPRVKSVFVEEPGACKMGLWDDHLPPVVGAEERSRGNLKTETSGRRQRAETLGDADNLPVPSSSLFLVRLHSTFRSNPLLDPSNKTSRFCISQSSPSCVRPSCPASVLSWCPFLPSSFLRCPCMGRGWESPAQSLSQPPRPGWPVRCRRNLPMGLRGGAIKGLSFFLLGHKWDEPLAT